MTKAVLLVFWNRPEYFKKVFEQVRIAQPPRLYLASDGPRNPEEEKVVVALRQWALDHVDWPCEVKTRFLEKNSGGCGPGVSGAVTWFFENESDGIILEDDIVPSQSFFRYCEELLDRYRDDLRVWHISGQAPYEVLRAKETYYFAKTMHCWGWASWANRWSHFRLDLSDYDESDISKFSSRKDVQAYWNRVLINLKAGKIDSWAYPWTLIIASKSGLCATPYKNLMTNIGLKGVHFANQSPTLCRPRHEVERLVHPSEVLVDEWMSNKIYTYEYGIGLNVFVRGWRRVRHEWARFSSVRYNPYSYLRIVGGKLKKRIANER